MTALGRLPFGLVLALLAVATLAGVFALDRLGFGAYSLVAIAITGAIAVAYLWEYSRRLEIGRASPTEEDDEPFDDPVEAALRPTSELPPIEPAPTPSGSTDATDVGAPARPVDADDGLE